MELSILLYFANLGVFCGCIAMGISYILAQTMHVMQDKPDTNKIKFHTKTTPLCGGISIFIAYVVIVLGGIEMPRISYSNYIISVNVGDFYEYAGLHFYIACSIVLCSGIIKDVYGKTTLWLIFCLQICGFCVLHLLFYIIHASYGYNLILIILPCYIMLFLATNGVNTIDGIHGNAALYSMIVLLALCYISYQIQSNFVGFATSILLGILFVFLLFNYPFGKMFLGDSGAFLLGFCIGALLLLCVLYYRINAWYCIALLLYPICAMFSSLFVQLYYIKTYKIVITINALWQRHDSHLHHLLQKLVGNTAALLINAFFACFVAFITYYHTDTIMILFASACFCLCYAICFVIFWRKKINLYNRT